MMNEKMNDITLKQAFDYFILDRESFCSDDTIANYKNTIRYFVQFMEEYQGKPAEEIRISSITRVTLREYVVYLRKKPKNEGHPFKRVTSETLTKRSIRNYSMDMKTFLNFLCNEGFMEDVTKGFKLIRAERKAIHPLTATEVALLDDCFNPKSATGVRNLCVVHLMLDAGLRSNEVCELRTNHILFDNRQIFVKYGKGSKERIVPMGYTLKRYLWQWFNLYRRYSPDHNYFLTSREGRPLSDAAVKSLFMRLRDNTGIGRLSPHLLRHTFATCFILGGGSVEMLRILMGHESIETTQVYMHVASVYDYQNDVYHLDPVFFRTYNSPRR